MYWTNTVTPHIIFHWCFYAKPHSLAFTCFVSTLRFVSKLPFEETFPQSRLGLESSVTRRCSFRQRDCRWSEPPFKGDIQTRAMRAAWPPSKGYNDMMATFGLKISKNDVVMYLKLTQSPKSRDTKLHY